ncbi:MAG TPA: ABC transporter permease [Gaiellaceae bacterium]|nr:ABC transporter permease [Gaiellaceae bacterium]
MSLGVTLATALRVAGQLRHDRRTVALVLVVPSALLSLLWYLFDNQPNTFARIGTPMVGVFPLIMMFLITSIAMLRERTTGTLERLMSMPLAKLDLLFGYGLAFAFVGAVQAFVTAAVAFGALDIETAGPIWAVVALAIANAVLGMALGLFVSAFATTEFQAVQFMPVFILPQFLLAGLFIPRERMPDVLERISDFLPFTYAYEALAKVAADDIDSRLWLDVGVVIGTSVLALALGALTLRRRTP